MALTSTAADQAAISPASLCGGETGSNAVGAASHSAGMSRCERGRSLATSADGELLSSRVGVGRMQFEVLGPLRVVANSVTAGA
jgi:hypothetical protein